MHEAAANESVTHLSASRLRLMYSRSLQRLPKVLARQFPCVRIAGVAEALGETGVPRPRVRAVPTLECGQNHVHVIGLHRVSSLVSRDHNLVELLAGANPDVLMTAARSDGLGEILQIHRWNLRHEDLP